MIKSFVDNFIKDIYKERILFELSSNREFWDLYITPSPLNNHSADTSGKLFRIEFIVDKLNSLTPVSCLLSVFCVIPHLNANALSDNPA